jgi:hypothetical protein
MDQQPIDNQFLLDLRRDLDALRDEVKGLATFVYAIEGTQRVLGEDTTSHIKHFYNAIDILHDMVAPIEAQIFPEVNRTRVEFAQIVDDHADRRDGETHAN